MQYNPLTKTKSLNNHFFQNWDQPCSCLFPNPVPLPLDKGVFLRERTSLVPTLGPFICSTNVPEDGKTSSYNISSSWTPFFVVQICSVLNTMEETIVLTDFQGLWEQWLCQKQTPGWGRTYRKAWVSHWQTWMDISILLPHLELAVVFDFPWVSLIPSPAFF